MDEIRSAGLLSASVTIATISGVIAAPIRTPGRHTWFTTTAATADAAEAMRRVRGASFEGEVPDVLTAHAR